MLVKLGLLALSLQSQPVPDRQSIATPDIETIVIYGRRAEEALAACIARNCPPAEEIEASIQAAGFQFGAGRYDRSANTLRQAIRRNRAHEAQLPGEMSSLHATLATVLRHDGRIAGMNASARTSVEILRRRLGTAHPGTLSEEMAMGDTLLRNGWQEAAIRKYHDVARTAEGAGHPQIAAAAHLRRAAFATARRQWAAADAAAAEAVRVSGGDADVAFAREVILLRGQASSGDEAAVDRLAQALKSRPRPGLQLLTAPPYPDFNPSHFGIITGVPAPAQLRFADIGFWIRADGIVEDATYLRGQHLGQYQKALLAQVAGRRYAPFTPPEGETGLYRIERVSVRGDFGVATGSRIGARSATVRVEVADLTATQEMADQALAATAKAEAAATPRTP